jgi:uncharacterized protein YbjT (DUF2867 family)
VAREGVEHRRADLRTGDGLDEALAGVQTVVEAANSQTAAQKVLVEGGRRLLAAEARAGVGHHVAISIVGCDRTPYGYYRVKVAQEEVVQGGPVPWSILRATQFHTLITLLFESAQRLRLSPGGSARLQPIDPGVVAARLADAVGAGPSGMMGDIGGPEIRTLSEFAAQWRAHSRHRLLVVPVPIPGRLGKALRSGSLCDPAAATPGPTYAEWLATRR